MATTSRWPRLRRVDCASPGLTRRRAGKGWVYLDACGRRITDADTLARIRALAIPPAWTDVWICPAPNGHIQALGTDAAGRRQYRYHDVWRSRRDAEKFDHMLEFAASLPALRSQVADHLDHPELDRERVLACAVRLLDLGFFRIGTEGYAESNQTYGLATMLKSHATITGDVVRFDYVAKSGKRRLQNVVDPAVVEVLRTLKRRRGGGRELLAYRAGGGWCDVKSADINAYIQEQTGEAFTAKDFRTWNATVLAAVALAVSDSVPDTQAARKRAVARAMSEVAHYLGNTPAVCRASYVDPRVVDRYLAGVTIHHALGALGDEVGTLATQGAVEAAVLALLSDAPPAAPAVLAKAG
jgi:DNA topoisomerase I